MEQTTHAHQSLALFALRNSAPNLFTCRSHHTYDLVKYLTQNFKFHSTLRQAALNRFSTIRYRFFYGALHFNATPDEVILHFYLELFDDIFFFGNLKSRCTVKLQMEKKKDFARPWTVRVYSPESGDIVSEIILHALDIEKREKRLVAYLGILLHEMIHVFLITYGCGVKGLSDDGKIEVTRGFASRAESEVEAEAEAKASYTCWENIYGVGGLGYGKAWQEIAYSFELAARDLLGLKLSLLRKWCLVADLCCSRVGPSLASNWGFDVGEIRRLRDENDKIVWHVCQTGGGILEYLVQQEYGLVRRAASDCMDDLQATA